ncbi:MrcB family domain-containing protein [Bradyrhizobium stylosanthis]|uniref:5-methylcytosine-specific restriction protein A n=1 Tax=Bradyrhizobium stylosanthis TaxID=1803665 RepID=A0A560ECZ1_9BRAD|nr:5-methylcytosine-specific restriction protein A [Bradyrhizobium stylosanthis]
MRDELSRWATEYPSAYLTKEAFSASSKARLVTHVLPDAIRHTVPQETAGLTVEGSAGQSKWTHTPWIAILDPYVTDSVQEGYYIVYLLSPDGSSIYLSLNQGCTLLKNELGLPASRAELLRRAALMRTRLQFSERFQATPIDLQSALWRAQLYTAGNIISARYDTRQLPSEAQLVADLREALTMYRFLRNAGGWTADDDIIRQAEEEGLPSKLIEAKRYRLHRSIERRAGNAAKVKKLQGTVCKGCDTRLSDVYGPVANGVIDAHHLKPMASLEANEIVELDPRTDFAVLCPNCHSIIHKFEDVSDVARLRKLLGK